MSGAEESPSDRHVPTLDTSGPLSWITCSCGWGSPAMLSQLEARSRWAQHEAEAAERQDFERRMP